jgi:hypothetical protein
MRVQSQAGRELVPAGSFFFLMLVLIVRWNGGHLPQWRVTPKSLGIAEIQDDTAAAAVVVEWVVAGRMERLEEAWETAGVDRQHFESMLGVQVAVEVEVTRLDMLSWLPVLAEVVEAFDDGVLYEAESLHRAHDYAHCS